LDARNLLLQSAPPVSIAIRNLRHCTHLLILPSLPPPPPPPQVLLMLLLLLLLLLRQLGVKNNRRQGHRVYSNLVLSEPTPVPAGRLSSRRVNVRWVGF
jgi:hypothetical protein